MDGLLQIVILICLIVVIILLVVDKVKIVTGHQKMKVVKEDTPNVIGKVLVAEKEEIPLWLVNRKKLVEKMAANNVKHLNIESVKNEQQEKENSNAQIKQEDDGNVFPDDDRFGQCVSLDELTKVGNLLQQDKLDASQEMETAEIIKKIQGTEFFSMMQDSIEGASQRIAKILDKSISESHEFKTVHRAADEINNFDIGDFI